MSEQKRYYVQHLDDPDGIHDDCRYFVLDPLHDPIARVALSAYERECRAQALDHLADELGAWRKEVLRELGFDS